VEAEDREVAPGEIASDHGRIVTRREADHLEARLALVDHYKRNSSSLPRNQVVAATARS
jgi:hypothetical protein